MAGIFLKLGTVRAQKSSMLINTAHRYEDKGDGVLCMKSNKDTRDIGVIASRNGLTRPCIMIDDSDDLRDVVTAEFFKMHSKGIQLKVILIDEGQFLSLKHAKQLLYLSNEYSILIYGLRCSYRAQTWEVIDFLSNFAKNIEEILNPCQFCDSLAKLNMRLENGEPVTNGDSIIIDESLENSDFVPVCPKCYIEKVFSK